MMSIDDVESQLRSCLEKMRVVTHPSLAKILTSPHNSSRGKKTCRIKSLEEIARDINTLNRQQH